MISSNRKNSLKFSKNISYVLIIQAFCLFLISYNLYSQQIKSYFEQDAPNIVVEAENALGYGWISSTMPDASGNEAVLFPKTDTLYFQVIEDTYVDLYNRNTPYGSESVLKVDGKGGKKRGFFITPWWNEQYEAFEKASFLKFAVTGLQNIIVEAKVFLYCVQGGRGGGIYELDPLQDNLNWTEDQATWNNRPSTHYDGNTFQDFVGNVGSGNWHSFDVTQALYGKGNGTYSFGIVMQEDDYTEWSSNEGSNPPYLMIRVKSSGYNISGHINYYSNDNPIVLAEMSLTGGAQLISSSNSSGYYTFSDLSEGLSYTLKASKASGTDIGIFDITTYDAALTAQAAVGLRILTEHEAIAADVSCDGHVYTYDAALIAQYSVGLPPVSSSHVGEWRFLPDSIDYSSLSGDEVDQDFTGILLGNVHGGWSGGGLSGQPMVYKGYDLLKEYVADTGEQLLITIYLPSSGDVISSDIEFCYDTAVLDFSGIVRTGLLRNVELYYYARDGRIRIGFYSIEPIDQSGELLKLRFRVKGSPGEESELRLARFQINDQVLYRGGSRLVVGDVMPQSYSLGQNYPNPFFPGGTGIDRVTRIKYSLPESGQVRLTIYNYLGQQIKDMAIGEKPAGRYEALWDGRDDLGRAVSAGVYFYRLEADRFIEMRRMVVLR